ncbi:hypothetical protein CSUI_010089 [Cystoisospora suis]|uniref:Uncharacterized protein n=1 Tax=Cystoisospora suis TaxID=483139 RepID=A0A2C6KG48_9APIC|nr:hypothetical protein CSUI_010089 [Cystoisospora suis]
MDERISLERKT